MYLGPVTRTEGWSMQMSTEEHGLTSFATLTGENTSITGQYHLFTGELDPAWAERNGNGANAESGWLFDPDWGLVLPENPAGQEIVVDQGGSRAFPAGGSEVPREPLTFGARPRPAPEPVSIAQTDDAAQLILSGFGI